MGRRRKFAMGGLLSPRSQGALHKRRGAAADQGYSPSPKLVEFTRKETSATMRE